MISSPRPYLKVTFFASTQRGMRSTSSCSTWTHSTGSDAAGEVEDLGLAERREGEEAGLDVVPAVGADGRSRSHTTGGLRHSSMIVHIENPGAKTSLPSSSRMTRLAPSRVPSSSISLKRWSAA